MKGPVMKFKTALKAAAPQIIRTAIVTVVIVAAVKTLEHALVKDND